MGLSKSPLIRMFVDYSLIARGFNTHHAFLTSMSASTWLVPLNVHHSLKLRSLTSSSNASSAHLQNISSSLNSLTNSINRIELNSIELTGTANAILELLQSKEYKDLTIGAMRNLMFNHAKTCKEAIKEDDSVLAYSICITSERIMTQPWFNFDLFSLVSFDEMERASEMQETCQNIMKGIEEKMNSEEREMTRVFVESMDKIEEARVPFDRAADEFVELYSERSMDDGSPSDVEKKGKKITIRYYRSGEPAGWLTEGTPGKFMNPTVFSSSRDITDIPIKKALPYLMGRKSPISIGGYSRYEKEEWCKNILNLHKKWKIEYDKYMDFEESVIASANRRFDGRIRIEGLFSDTNQEDLDDVSISNDLSILDDGDYLIDIMKIHSEIDNENEAKFIGVNKNMSIDESIIEHYTQILFLIHEMGYPIDWPSFRFTRNELIECYKRDILANKDELIFDEDFIIDFPEYIDDFIREFCIPQ